MRFTDFLGKLFTKKAGTYEVTSYRAEADAEVHTALDAFALFSVVHTIANLISGCEFRTFRNNKEMRGAEWVSMNIKPNSNQNGAEWKAELVSRMLLFGEALCIQLADGQRIIAEGFSKQDYAIYDAVFSNISKADMTFSRTYRASDVFYLRSEINARSVWLSQVMAEYEKLMSSAAARFQNADGERGILNISAQERHDKDFAKRFSELMNDYFKGYFSGKNAVLPLFEGYTYTAQSGSKSGTYTNDLTAVKTLADEALARAAQVFGVPPSYIRGDAAGIKNSQSAMLTNCIKPIARQISAELTAKLFTVEEICTGCRVEVDTGSIIHHDLIDGAQSIDKLIGSGWSHNEVRRALGQPELDEEWADEHFITKNYGTIEQAMKGGEDDVQSMGYENDRGRAGQP